MFGIFIFTVALAALLFVLRLAGTKYYDYKSGEKPQLSKRKKRASSKDGSEIDPEIVAVIAAAAGEMYNQKIKIRKIRFIEPLTDHSWSRAGRMNIMSSHEVQPMNK